MPQSERDNDRDLIDERFAIDSLRCATTEDELIAAWWANCNDLTGSALEHAQDEYALKLRELGYVVQIA